MMKFISILLAVLVVSAEAFLATPRFGASVTDPMSMSPSKPGLRMAKDEKKKGGFFQDLKGMFDNFDDVVDDFVYKRMGAGEQWYGKRKYNPSGKFDGDYQGMGRSDQFRIELARVQKEEMEKRRLRRLAEEEEARKNK